MSSFLKEVKERTVTAAKLVQGFDFTASRYESANSYEEALHLFFTNLLRGMREALATFPIEAAVDPKLAHKQTQKILNFYSEMLSVMERHVVDLAKIAKMHNASADPKSDTILAEKKKEFAIKLEKEFTALRQRAAELLTLNETLDLNIDTDVIYAITAWSQLTFDSFFTMLKEGKVSWITPRE